MVSSSPPSDRELAGILQGIGLGLLMVYVIGVLKLLLPPALFQAAWQLRAAEALRATAALPLVASVLLLLAERLDAGAEKLEQRLLVLRRLAVCATIGFLLLIPLQISAGMRQLSQTAASEARQLEAVRQVAKAIEEADSPEAMNRAIARLPGLPPDFRGQYARPLSEVRLELLAQIRPQIETLPSRLDQLHRQRLFRSSGLFVLDGLMSLAYAIAFAALASTGRGQPSLLQFSLWKLGSLGVWMRRPGRGRRVEGPVSHDWLRSLQDGVDDNDDGKAT